MYNNRLNNIMSNIVELIFILFFMFPLLWLLWTSIKEPLLAFQMPPVWIFKPTIKNYLEVLSRGPFLKSLGNTVIVAVGSSLITTILAIPGAYLLTRVRFKGRGILSMWTIVIRMAPPVAFILALYTWLRSWGLLDSYLGLIMVYQIISLPLAIWIIRAFFLQIPYELEEAATIDGANKYQIIIRVMMPLIKPGIVTVLILSFINGWNEFFYALIISGRNTRTLPVTIQSFVSDTGIEWGNLTSASIIVVAPVLVFSILVRKGFIKGLAAGSIK